MNSGKGNYNQGHVKNNLCSLNFVIVCRLNKKTVYNYDFFDPRSIIFVDNSGDSEEDENTAGVSSSEEAERFR